MITYGELRALLNDMSEQQLAKAVVVYDVDADDVLTLAGLDVTGEEDGELPVPDHVLDDGHPYLVLVE